MKKQKEELAVIDGQISLDLCNKDIDMTKEFEKIKLIVTVFSNKASEEKTSTNYIVPFFIRKADWKYYQQTSNISQNAEDLLRAYRLYFARVFMGHEVKVRLQEISKCEN